MDAVDRAVAAHRTRWGEPVIVARAPGRVNLIGEHTDYNDGFALPMALPFDTAVAISDEGDPESGRVEISSAGFGDVSLDPTSDTVEVDGWARHAAGVVLLLARSGIPVGGWRATIETDIPTGASLSSSAALEVALTSALLARAGLEWTPGQIAAFGQRVENEVVGLQSGIMDQLISAGAVAGHASLMDCRTLSLDPVPLDRDVTVVVMDTGTRRVLADVAYDERRRSCEAAAEVLGVPALRDASIRDLERIDDEVLRRRARHVVTENERTLMMAGALRAGDVGLAGAVMSDSHASLRDDYEVSSAALDAIVDAAGDAPGCLGARMTGGGFAGCAVALVTSSEVPAFDAAVRARYRSPGEPAVLWPCAPAGGASARRVG